MSNRTRKWLRGGLEILIHGLTAAFIATMTANLVDHNDWALFSANFWKLGLANFSANGLLRFVQYFNNNPLPPEGDSSLTTKDGQQLIPSPKISLNPLSKVTPLTPAGEPPKG